MAAIGSYSGSSNILTPISDVAELWNETGGPNIVQSVATWNGSPSLEIGWDSSVSDGWPWAIAGVALRGSVGGGDVDAPQISLTEPVDSILPGTFTVAGTVPIWTHLYQQFLM